MCQIGSGPCTKTLFLCFVVLRRPPLIFLCCVTDSLKSLFVCCWAGNTPHCAAAGQYGFCCRVVEGHQQFRIEVSFIWALSISGGLLCFFNSSRGVGGPWELVRDLHAQEFSCLPKILRDVCLFTCCCMFILLEMWCSMSLRLYVEYHNVSFWTSSLSWVRSVWCHLHFILLIGLVGWDGVQLQV